MAHTREPGKGHHQLLSDLKSICGRAGLNGITDVEQIAILAQLIGSKIHGLDERQYDSGEIMLAVSRNIVAGNSAAGGVQNLIGLGKPS